MSLWLPRGYRAESETEVKRSRFIATLARVDSEEEARALIGEVRRTYPDARHHCSAFVVEVPDANPIERSSDDGEPAGTAGMPMLDVLRGADVAQAVCVVTRYFGGVLLGTGGLVRAYSDAVSDALARAGRVRPERRALFRLSLDHAEAGRVQAELMNAGCELADAAYGATADLTFAVSDADAFGALAASVTRGTVEPEPAGWLVVEVPVSA